MGTVAAAENCKHENFKTFETQVKTFTLKSEVDKELTSTVTTSFKVCSDCKKAFDVDVITSNTNVN